MKLMTGILAVVTMTGGVWAQDPNIINNVQSSMKGVQQKKADDSNAALSGAPAGTQAKKPGTAGYAPAQKAVASNAGSSIVSGKSTAKTPSAKNKIVAHEKPSAVSKSVENPAKPQDQDKNKQEKKWSMSGRRDPFFSPVVQQTSGSGCSTGKKCLEIGQINVRGVVKSDAGFIAVVTNSLNKAYFLHENDPVFNGYVVRITGDSVVFQENIQDKLGKTSKREVVKKILTPAV
jgi:Tfp pilus assembly protein PilP